MLLLLLLLSHINRVRLCATPWMAAQQAPLSLGFSRQEYWVGCHFLLQCMKVKLLSRVQLLETPWTVTYHSPSSMGFSRQEYWSGVSLPSPDTNIIYRKFCHLKDINNINTTIILFIYCYIVQI